MILRAYFALTGYNPSKETECGDMKQLISAEEGHRCPVDDQTECGEGMVSYVTCN